MNKPPSFNIRWLAYGLGVVILSVICYAVVRVSNPYFKSKAKVISEVMPFQFTNQYGQQVTDSILNHKVAIVYFFFTSCKNVCPMMYQSVKLLYTPYMNNTNVLVLAHTCDPDTDTVARLRWYQDHMNIPAKGWLLLTGEKQKLYEAVRFSYKIHDAKKPADTAFNFMHTQLIALVKNKKVLRIIDGLDVDEMKAAAVFLKENMLSN